MTRIHLAMSILAALVLALPAPAQTVLPGTHPLTLEGDLAAKMVDGINQFLERETASRPRTAHGSREELQRIIGAVDARVPFTALQITASTNTPAEVARANGYRVYSVRWPVFEDVDAEGLLLQPEGKPKARIVALPDADWTPEMLAGLSSGIEPAAQFARRLAENGCQVLIPALIDRKETWSGIPGIRMTNQPHREWIYRMAYENGRHIIGYEVQKVLAAVDWFTHENAANVSPVSVAGYGEGGLLALYSAALDARVQAVLVSGYFGPRDEVWREPIYRDVWGLLQGGFTDAELARMIAPRPVIVEASRFPEITGPPPGTPERRGAAPVGSITTPPLDAVRGEVARAGSEANVRLVASGDGRGLPGSQEALVSLLGSLGVAVSRLSDEERPSVVRTDVDTDERLHRQFNQLVTHTQALVRTSDQTRAAWWSKADASSPEAWNKTTQPMRRYIWDEVIGRLPDPNAPANPRTRLVFDEPKYRGYEVMLDVWPGVFAYGILLVPKNVQPGEKRPVVVCQHGLEGRPRDVADPKEDSHYYHRFAVRLAEEGFVTFAPQNPYIGEDRFRIIQRKGHPLKLSLFSFILGQHQRILEWLGGLPFVDRQRIGFYGLSYGGKTAVRVPPLLDGYALSICSADFNEWVWKTTSIGSPYSYMLTNEYDMLEFNFANVVNYSDLANLMAPRPFMVERGHDDGVAPDEWVAYEYAKVRRFYDRMDIGNRTEIEFFNGPHTIHGVGTFAFLRAMLQWPR
jgi:dienelactone hydrolase